MVCVLIPGYNVDFFILSRMLGINILMENLCRNEDMVFVDVWDHCNKDKDSKDRRPYSSDGLHLNKVEKVKLVKSIR